MVEKSVLTKHLQNQLSKRVMAHTFATILKFVVRQIRAL